MPSAMNSTDKANAGAPGTPTCAKNQTNAACPVPSPLTVIGQQHHEQDQRDEREVGRERRLDAEAPAQVVRLEDAEDLHGDRAGEHLRQLRVMGGVPLNRFEQPLPASCGERVPAPAASACVDASAVAAG